MSTTDVLSETVERISLLVKHYHRDLPFRAPESIPEHQARLLNRVWTVLEQGQRKADA